MLNLKTMEGFNFAVKYSKEDGCISDMHGLLAKLLPKECQFFLFKYLGGANFEVFLLDVGCVLQGIPGMNSYLVFICHIEYPMMTLFLSRKE